MGRLLRTAIVVAGSSLVMVHTASAGLLNIATTADSTYVALPVGAPNDVIPGASGWFNANLQATDNVYLKYTYIGKEAAWLNALHVDGSQVFDTSATSVGATVHSSATTGSWLDFAFSIIAGGNAGHSVANGANNAPYQASPEAGYGLHNFFLSYADETQNTVYAALDDGGGPAYAPSAWSDNDYDDLVVKITARVPEPSSVALLGLGLLGLSLARRSSHK